MRSEVHIKGEMLAIKKGGNVYESLTFLGFDLLR